VLNGIWVSSDVAFSLKLIRIDMKAITHLRLDCNIHRCTLDNSIDIKLNIQNKTYMGFGGQNPRNLEKILKFESKSIVFQLF
jgi:hypothetical protein